MTVYEQPLHAGRCDRTGEDHVVVRLRNRRCLVLPPGGVQRTGILISNSDAGCDSFKSGLKSHLRCRGTRWRRGVFRAAREFFLAGVVHECRTLSPVGSCKPNFSMR
jgi:hypothetical protein